LGEKHLSRRRIFDPVGEQLGAADFVLGQSGERHVRLRRLLALAYSREVASSFVPDFVAAVREVMADWKPGSVHRVMPVIKRMAFEQYCRVMCGRSLAEHYRDIIRVTEYNMNIGGRVWPFFLYRSPHYQAARKRVLDLMWTMVRERRAAAPEHGGPKTIMDTLLSLRDKNGEHLSDDEVVCYSMYGFAGSASYMGRLVAFMLHQILKDPALKESVVREADRALSAGLRNVSEVREMELLRAVYHETLRFHPVSQGMPFYAEHDFTYEGRRICQGDTVVLSQVPMSFSDRWFRDPLRFDHTRMMNPRNEHRGGSGFHPFGIAHRTCTAMGLVELMAVTLVATILHEKSIDTVPAEYRLKLKVRPLPAPNDRFGIRTSPRIPGEIARAGVPPTEESITATFPGHDEPRVNQILAGAKLRQFAGNEVIIRQGDAADAFYILESGTVRVSRMKGAQEEFLADLGPGKYFGEIGLLQGVPRTATVAALSDSVRVLELSRESFMDLVESSDLFSGEIAAMMRKRTAENSLREALPGITPAEMVRILPEFRTQVHEAGNLIIREGDNADRFYIVVGGVAVVTRGDEEIARLRTGQYFGEIGLLTGCPRTATVRISDEGPATLLSTDIKGFRAVVELGNAADDLAQTMLRRVGELRRGK